jgi:hypothetical protein
VLPRRVGNTLRRYSHVALRALSSGLCTIGPVLSINRKEGHGQAQIGAKAQAAAVKAAGGGTAGAVTTDFTGNGYEVTVTKTDGPRSRSTSTARSTRGRAPAATPDTAAASPHTAADPARGARHVAAPLAPIPTLRHPDSAPRSTLPYRERIGHRTTTR